MPNAMDSKAAPPARRASFSRLGPAAFAAGGLAAAFGAASCCAIPMLLGGVGLGGLGSAMFIPVLAPFQSYMVGAALVSLVIGGALLWRRSCACDASGGRMATTLTVVGLALGAGLLALGLAYG